MAILRQTLFLPYTFPGANQFLKDMSWDRYLGAKTKKQWTDIVVTECKVQKLIPYTVPVLLSFLWLEPNAKRDPDNIIFGKKFILDGLVLAGIIPDDSQKWVRGFNSERWIVVDKPRVGVQVKIQEGTPIPDEPNERID